MRNSSSCGMVRLWAALLAVSLSAAVCAFEPVKGAKMAPIPEQGQGTLSAQQQHSGRVGIVGSVDMAPRKESPAPNTKTPAKAEAMAAGDSEAGALGHSGQAAGALRQVELEKQLAATSPFRNLIWAVVVVAIGLGLAFLVKFFADKNMPQVPTKTRVNW